MILIAQYSLCRGEPGFVNVASELQVPGGFHKYVLAAKKWHKRNQNKTKCVTAEQNM